MRASTINLRVKSKFYSIILDITLQGNENIKYSMKLKLVILYLILKIIS